ncbi:MAG: hypothetical protein AVDCRST_MAG69-1314, partial [uncultured Solirubrobacteraceae bacterium]
EPPPSRRRRRADPLHPRHGASRPGVGRPPDRHRRRVEAGAVGDHHPRRLDLAALSQHRPVRPQPRPAPPRLARAPGGTDAARGHDPTGRLARADPLVAPRHLAHVVHDPEPPPAGDAQDPARAL